MGLSETFQQGSPEWLEWRTRGIGASEIPVLMGESDFDTPLGIWKIKRGLVVEEKNQFVMQRGLEAEPKIRALFNLLHDHDMEPDLFQHPDIPYMRASLDGWDEKSKSILEMKYPGKDKHELAVAGQVPPCYIGQCQAQLFVTGAERLFYVSYDGQGIAVVSVSPDPVYWSRMLPVVQDFWALVQSGTPPALTDRDYLEVTDEALKKLFAEWKRLKAESAGKDDLEAVREAIIQALPHPRVICEGVQVVPQKRASGITYAFKEVSLKGKQEAWA